MYDAGLCGVPCRLGPRGHQGDLWQRRRQVQSRRLYYTLGVHLGHHRDLRRPGAIHPGVRAVRQAGQDASTWRLSRTAYQMYVYHNYIEILN